MKNCRTKLFLTPMLLVGLLVPIGLVGCGDTSESTTKVEQSGPGGTTTQETTDKIKQTGESPPPPIGTPQPPPATPPR